MKFKIRQLKEEDLVDGSGFFETMSNLVKIKDLDIATRKKVFRNASGKGVYILVAVSDEEGDKEQIVSTVKLFVEPKFFYGGRSTGHIEDVATREGFEGNGLAKALLGRAIEIAKKDNCYKIILDCRECLVPFYEKSGFKNHDICMKLNFVKDPDRECKRKNK
ncbi:MAG: GNAT family N-acetyltransferase [Candidatus Komeilibacteria bacterium]|jgi:glucosamine-phosphate N-acetyltransferase|nr:GNAT family N-acetyltransferase [Candidatus Komeilibacteria bacterium]MBT4447285.1 GNAT family N-acetyltransferase [Candidatus Komeilibacteria bacterium]